MDSMIIGQYIPGNSLIHRLDPRTTLIIIIFYVIVVLLANNAACYCLLSAFVLISLINTRIPSRYNLKGLISIWFLMLFTFILHLFVTKEGEVIYEVFTLKIYSGWVQQGLMISLRFGLLIFMTSLLTLTTTPIEITDAIEELLQIGRASCRER